MPTMGFEPTISAGERLQTYAFRSRGHWDRLNSEYMEYIYVQSAICLLMIFLHFPRVLTL